MSADVCASAREIGCSQAAEASLSAARPADRFVLPLSPPENPEEAWRQAFDRALVLHLLGEPDAPAFPEPLEGTRSRQTGPALGRLLGAIERATGSDVTIEHVHSARPEDEYASRRFRLGVGTWHGEEIIRDDGDAAWGDEDHLRSLFTKYVATRRALLNERRTVKPPAETGVGVRAVDGDPAACNARGSENSSPASGLRGCS